MSARNLIPFISLTLIGTLTFVSNVALAAKVPPPPACDNLLTKPVLQELAELYVELELKGKSFDPITHAAVLAETETKTSEILKMYESESEFNAALANSIAAVRNSIGNSAATEKKETKKQKKEELSLVGWTKSKNISFPGRHFNDAAWAADGRHLVFELESKDKRFPEVSVVLYDTEQNRTVHFRNQIGGSRLQNLFDRMDPSPDGKFVMIQSSDLPKGVAVLDMMTLNEAIHLPAQNLNNAVHREWCGPNHDIAILNASTKTLSLITHKNGKPVTITKALDSSEFKSLAKSADRQLKCTPDGKTVMFNFQNQIFSWDTQSPRKSLVATEFETGPVRDFFISPSGRYLTLLAGKENTFLVYDLTANELLIEFESVELYGNANVKWLPGEQQFILQYNQDDPKSDGLRSNIQLFDLAKKREIPFLGKDKRRFDESDAPEVTADGKTLYLTQTARGGHEIVAFTHDEPGFRFAISQFRNSPRIRVNSMGDRIAVRDANGYPETVTVLQPPKAALNEE